MGKPCSYDHTVSEPYTLAQCRVCWLYQFDVRYRRLWDGLAFPAARVSLPCIHQGRFQPPPVGADPRREWLACEAGKGVVCRCDCNDRCDRFEPDEPDQVPPVRRRHLVYHLLPVTGNGSWQRGVDQLRARWGLFTGSKVIAITVGTAGAHKLDSPDAVREYLPSDCEVIEVCNDPTLREVVSWIPLWERVLSNASGDDAILYAHAKAVTRQVDPGNSCQWWTSLAYTLHLDHWPVVARQLSRFPITGAFKKLGHGFSASPSSWHYSGTFFWVRSGDFRDRLWRDVEQTWFGTESWPGLAYHSDEAGCLFLTGTVENLDLYSPDYWTATVRPRYAEWLRQNPPSFPWMDAATSPAVLSVIT